MPVKTFISYSHENSTEAQALKRFFAVMEREGEITFLWDKGIMAGEKIDPAIKSLLEESQLILCLISEAWLDSSYCVDKELKLALENSKKKGVVVVPIILDYCDWENFPPLKERLALPKDGLPITEWSNPNKARKNIVDGIRGAIQKIKEKKSEKSAAAATFDKPEKSFNATEIADGEKASSALLPHKFSDLEKEQYRQKSFDDIKAKLSTTLNEIPKQNSQWKGLLKPQTSDLFQIELYQEGNLKARGSVFLTQNQKSRLTTRQESVIGYYPGALPAQWIVRDDEIWITNRDGIWLPIATNNYQIFTVNQHQNKLCWKRLVAALWNPGVYSSEGLGDYFLRELQQAAEEAYSNAENSFYF